jgi:hypothetical protein
MSEAKILGVTNISDAIWFRLTPGDDTLGILDTIFEFRYDIFTEDSEKKLSYAFHTMSRDKNFAMESDDIMAYFIFTPRCANVILRKTLDWKKSNDMISAKFEFADRRTIE